MTLFLLALMLSYSSLAITFPFWLWMVLGVWALKDLVLFLLANV